MANRVYGWKPDVDDERDICALYATGKLPASVDLRPQCPPVYDQGQLGSCTANAIAAALELDRMKQKLPVFIPSRLFIYYNERAMEGSVNEDSGASLRDGIKSVNSLGVCDEAIWPYDIYEFAVKPPASAYTAAKLDRALAYRRITQTTAQLEAALAAGYPVVFGFTVYESFESDEVAKTGIVPMPTAGEQVLGGHAVVLVGYDSSTKRFLVRNSWGSDWGLQGYCSFPFQYLTSKTLANDFWQVRSVGPK